MLSIIAVLVGPAAATNLQERHPARIAVWDCQQPTSTAVYDELEFCAPVTAELAGQRSHEVLLAQAITRHKAEGFKCEATRTTRSHICGAFSYEKALPSLTSTTQLKLSESECREIFYNGVFRDPETGHKEHEVKGEGVFHFSASVRGVEYIAGGDTACQGVSAVVNGQVIDRLVQSAEYTLRVTKERFEMTQKTVVAMSTGEELPCVPNSRGCTGASHTYSWTAPQSMDCPLQVIRQITMTQESGSAILVDESAQIVLEITSSVPTEVGTCPGRWLKTTEPRILVVMDSSAKLDLETVQPEEVDPFLALSMNRMYIEYWRDMQHAAKGDLTELQECRQQLRTLRMQHTVEMEPGKFIRQAGDAVEVYECRRLITTIRSADRCYRDIPVHGDQPFADVHNRVLRSASPEVPCAREFPMRVRGLQQQWWRVDPVVIKESAPQKRRGQRQLHSPTHMDRPSGLYSDNERSQWATLQAVPVYQEMILNRIELGSCQAVSQCPSAMAKGDGSGFNLGLLEKEIPGYAWYEALTNPQNWISVGALILAMVSLMVQGVLYMRSRGRSGAAEQQTAVGVTITNAPEPSTQRVYVRETAPVATAATYGIADVTEEHPLVTLPVAPVVDQYGNPRPSYNKV